MCIGTTIVLTAVYILLMMLLPSLAFFNFYPLQRHSQLHHSRAASNFKKYTVIDPTYLEKYGKNTSHWMVRVVSPKHHMQNITSIANAMKMAETAKLQLVMIAEQATPPVCQIVDVNKLRYQQEKDEKQKLRKQRRQGIKEIRLTALTADHDLMIKCKSATRFLYSGNQVKFLVLLKGRERRDSTVAYSVLNRTKDILNAHGLPQRCQRIGSTVTQIFNPRPLHSRQKKQL